MERVFGPFRKRHPEMRRYPTYYPISGAEDVAAGNLRAIFPESARKRSRVMNKDSAEDLRGWLREPFFSQNQRTPLNLELDSRQLELSTTRSTFGYRRIKGPAGSGKSVVLAARASTLAAKGKHVLVVSYNITLLNYLRDLAVRHSASRMVIRRQIDLLNFHQWCKRVCHLAGRETEYRQLWRGMSDDKEQRKRVLDSELPSLMKRLFNERRGQGCLPEYDAILVDEGQDFRLSWWDVLRLAVKAGGEMVLVADKTQNIYGTASEWTEEKMTNAGFRGPWQKLETSYRLPPALVPHVARFAEQFLVGEETDMPHAVPSLQQMPLDLFPVELRWVHVQQPERIVEAAAEELRDMMRRLPTGTAITDITVLVSKQMGEELAGRLRAQHSVKVLHTFHTDEREARRQKRAFFQGAAHIKATTLHSFKGWEARHLLVVVENLANRALLYTALTRLRNHRDGSALTVVSSSEKLRAYGQTWPHFDVR